MSTATYQLPSLPLPLTDVALYHHALAIIEAVGLSGWSFGWDRAKRRLGCCNFTSHRISLSAYFVLHFMEKDPQLIHETLLHEVAHALAFTHHGERTHGDNWRKYCIMLGIPNETVRSKCEAFAPVTRPNYRYVLRHKETGEVFRHYVKSPRTSPQRLAGAYIRGRKEETLGKLEIVPIE